MAQFLRSAISSSKRVDGVWTEETAPEASAEGEQQDALAAAIGGGDGSSGKAGDSGGDGPPTTTQDEIDRDEARVLLLESKDDPLAAPCQDERLDECRDTNTLGNQSNDEGQATKSEESASGNKYTVAYECYEIEQPAESHSFSASNVERARLYENDGAKRLQFIDVLLQPDAHGLGLNIQVERDGVDTKAQVSPTSRIGYPGCGVLVVASFRRLHQHDLGPAEATRQIQKGDILHSIDGEEVRDWQHLLDIINQSTRRVRSNQADAIDTSNDPFLLLRFLRRRVDSPLESPVSTASLSTDEEEYSGDAERVKVIECSQRAGSDLGVRNHHQVALLIRELATKNQTLQDELVASKLKQEEQRIHLEQLYALYAKTQLDNSPLFALPKPSILPFTRRASSVSVPSSNDKISFVSTRFASAAGVGAKADPTLKLHAEIELAVLAEQERLRNQYQLQLDIESREAAARHQRELGLLKARMEKKVEMLEAGLQLALRRAQQAEIARHVNIEDQTTNTGSIETCSCGTWMRLQQELYIHQSLDHDDGGDSGNECLVCNLLTDARRMSSAAVATAPIKEGAETQEEKLPPEVSRIQRVLQLLREYEAVKQIRAQRFEAINFCTKADQEKPLQPLCEEKTEDDGNC